MQLTFKLRLCLCFCLGGGLTKFDRHTHTYTHTYCVLEREREREREQHTLPHCPSTSGPGRCSVRSKLNSSYVQLDRVRRRRTARSRNSFEVRVREKKGEQGERDNKKIVGKREQQQQQQQQHIDEDGGHDMSA